MARGSSILSALEVWLAQRRIPRMLFYYVAVNVLVFLVVKLLVITLQSIAPDAALSLFYSFALPSDLGRLASHPWTLFTHFFFHQSFTHLLFNMLWLWVFGRMFLEHFTSRQFHWVYWLGGIAGGLSYLMVYNLFSYFSDVVHVSAAMGASASIMAITLATVVAAPNNVVYLFGLVRVRIVWLALAMVVLDFLSITQSNAGGHIAHLGGALVGTLYAFLLLQSKRSRHTPWQVLLVKWGAFFASLSKRNKQTAQKQDPKRSAPNDEVEIQRILAKLAKGGYASLSNEEKEKLFRK